MTVSSTTNKVTDLGNGVSTAFSFPFIGVSDSDIDVIFTDASGVSTTLIEGLGPTQYQLALNAALPGQLWGLGGVVTYNPSGVPIPSGSTITIVRELPETQDFSITNQSSYGAYLRATEQALDYVTMLIQQVSETQNRAIVVPVVDANPPTPLPPAAQRANMILAFDGSGNPIAASLTAGTGLISSAMQPVVSASTLAAGRTAFGLRGLAVLDVGSGLSVVGTNANVLFTPNSIAISTAINASFHLQKLKVTGPVTLTLARASSLFNGFGFWVENLNPGGNLTIAIDSNDKIENGATGASIIIPPGASFYITTNAAASGTWWVELSLGNRVAPPVQGNYKNLSIKVLTGAVGNNTVAIAADSVIVTDGIYTYNTALSLTLSFATVGAGGIANGAIASNSPYAIWAIFNPISGAASAIASLQFTANGTFLAQLPAGFTAYARIGAVITAVASAALFGTWQIGNRVQFKVGLGTVTNGLPQLITGTSGNPTVGPTWTSVPLTSFLPPTAKSIYGVILLPSSTTGVVIVAPNNSYGIVTSNTNPPPVAFDQGAGSVQANYQFDMLLESTAIFYASSTAGTALYALGWEDSLV